MSTARHHKRRTKESPTTHELRVWDVIFQATWDERKRFDVVRADAEYRRGDMVQLIEIVSETKIPTGRWIRAAVTYVLQPTDDIHSPGYGLRPGYVAVGFREIDRGP